jgi:hypothetical protein
MVLSPCLLENSSLGSDVRFMAKSLLVEGVDAGSRRQNPAQSVVYKAFP